MQKIITVPNILFIHSMPVAIEDHETHNTTTSTSTFTDKGASVGRYARIYKHQEKMRYWGYTYNMSGCAVLAVKTQAAGE